MSWTERIFVLVMFLTGGVVFYILSLFSVGNGGREKNEPALLLPSDDMELARSSQVKLPSSYTSSIYYQNPSGSGQSPQIKPFESPLGSFPSLNEDNGPTQEPYTPVISTKARQSSMLKRLQEAGFGPNERFTTLLLNSLDRSDWLKEKSTYRKLLKNEEHLKAMELAVKIREASDEDNLLFRLEMTGNALEAALAGGRTDLATRLIQEHTTLMEAVVEAMEESSLTRFHKGRDQINQMKDTIRRTKSGSIYDFFQAMQTGAISTTEILAAAKANARMHVHEADFEISSRDIEDAASQGEKLFVQMKE